MRRTLIGIGTLVLLCSGCATEHVHNIGRYQNRFGIVKTFQDDQHLYFQVEHRRAYYGGGEQRVVDRFVVLSDAEGLARRLSGGHQPQSFTDGKGRRFARRETFCEQDFGVAWERYPVIFTEQGDWTATDGRVSSTQLTQFPREMIWKHPGKLSVEEYELLPKISDGEGEAVLQLYCTDSFTPEMDFSGYLSILLIPPAVLFDIVTFPIQFYRFYSSVSKIKG